MGPARHQKLKRPGTDAGGKWSSPSSGVLAMLFEQAGVLAEPGSLMNAYVVSFLACARQPSLEERARNSKDDANDVAHEFCRALAGSDQFYGKYLGRCTGRISVSSEQRWKATC